MNRLVPFDERMVNAIVWFSSNSMYSLDQSTNINMFEGDPVWTITSLNCEFTSVPKSKL